MMMDNDDDGWWCGSEVFREVGPRWDQVGNSIIGVSTNTPSYSMSLIIMIIIIIMIIMVILIIIIVIGINI